MNKEHEEFFNKLSVKKRDGKFQLFNVNKIKEAITKAFKNTYKDYETFKLKYEYIIDEKLLKKIKKRIIYFVNNTTNTENIKFIDIENIQDIVEDCLIEYKPSKNDLYIANITEVAKSYILYRKERSNVRKTESLLLDINKTMDGYLDSSDWRVKENATVNYSLGGLILHNSGAITANYWLNNIYNEEIAEAHKKCAFHIHDLSMFSGYCAGWSLRQLIKEGLGGVDDKITSLPASHLSTLTNQMVNFLGILQNEWAGAQAFSSFDTYLAPFVKADNLTEKEVKQCIQSFIYGVNTPSRWGSQAPFTNITLDWVVPDDLKDMKAIVGGKEMDFTYGDCKKEMDMINKAFIQLMIEGDTAGRGFQYPIPTYNITKNFDWENENTKLLFEMTARYGTPYFQNFVNSDLNPGDVRSMCCRLQLDKRELRKRGGGLFGSDEFTGSIGVVTINLPQIGYLTNNKEEFYKRLYHLMDLAKDSLLLKRKTINRLLENGLFPYTKRYLSSFRNHFNTIGLCGMNECCLNFLGVDIVGPKGKEFAEEILTNMRNRIADYQEETGELFNLEATPAESTSYRLAKHDKENYPDIITSGEEDPFYTNSSQLPVDYTSDIFEAMDHQESLQTKYTGGTVFHIFMGEAVKDWTTCRDLIRTITKNYKIPYITISPVFSVCKIHGYLNGQVYECPICKSEKELELRSKLSRLQKEREELLKEMNNN